MLITFDLYLDPHITTMSTIIEDLVCKNIYCEKDLDMLVFCVNTIESAKIVIKLIKERINFLIGGNALNQILLFVGDEYCELTNNFYIVNNCLNTITNNNVYLFDFNANIGQVKLTNGVNENCVSFILDNVSVLLESIKNLFDSFVDGKFENDQFYFQYDSSKLIDKKIVYKNNPNLWILETKMMMIINMEDFDYINFIKYVENNNIVFKF